MKARMLIVLAALNLSTLHARAAGHVDLGDEIELTLRKSNTQRGAMVQSAPPEASVAAYNSAWERLKRRKRVAYATNEDVQIVLKPIASTKRGKNSARN